MLQVLYIIFNSAWVESIGTEEIALTWREFDLCGVYKTIDIKKRGLEIDLWLKRFFNLRDSDLGRVNLLYIVFVSDPLASICLLHFKCPPLKNTPLFLHFFHTYTPYNGSDSSPPPPPPIGYEPIDGFTSQQPSTQIQCTKSDMFGHGINWDIVLFSPDADDFIEHCMFSLEAGAWKLVIVSFQNLVRKFGICKSFTNLCAYGPKKM